MTLTHVSMEEPALREQGLNTLVNAQQTSLVSTAHLAGMDLAFLTDFVVRDNQFIIHCACRNVYLHVHTCVCMSMGAFVHVKYTRNYRSIFIVFDGTSSKKSGISNIYTTVFLFIAFYCQQISCKENSLCQNTIIEMACALESCLA